MIQIILIHLIRVYALFYSTFSNNLASLLLTSDTTADQTAPSNQDLHNKLFCRFKQTRKKIRVSGCYNQIALVASLFIGLETKQHSYEVNEISPGV